jgi:hypothetical protein
VRGARSIAPDYVRQRLIGFEGDMRIRLTTAPKERPGLTDQLAKIFGSKRARKRRKHER